MNLFEELKRRNVFRVAVAYLVIAWLLAQVSSTFESALNLPVWFDSMVISLMIIVFPIVVFFSWAYEITEDGIKLEKDIDDDASIAHITAKKLDYITIFAVALLLGMAIWQQLFPNTQTIEQAKRLLDQQAAVEKKASSSLSATEPSNVVVGAATDSATANINSRAIAVLPFVNRSNNDEDLYFTDGMHEDILTQLAKIKGLRVISRTSVLPYRGTKKSMENIAKELGVAMLLEGGMQRVGNRIRFNTQLIDVTKNTNLWAESYDRELTVEHIFDIQSEITTHLVKSIKGQVTPQERELLEDKPTNSLAAWEAFSKARALMRNSGYNADKFHEALPLVEKALRHDPAFVLPQVMAANIHSSIYWIESDTSDYRQEKALSELDKAIELDPTSAEVLAAQGEYFYRIKLDYATALKFQKLALAQKPADSEILQAIAFSQRRLGLWQESIESLLKADQLDPTDMNNISHAAENLSMMREYQQLAVVLAQAKSRFPDSSDIGATAVHLPISVNGDLKKAREIYDTITPNVGDAYVEISVALPILERDYKKALATLNQAEIVTFYDSYPASYFLERGLVYRLLGEKEQAQADIKHVIELLTPINYQRNEFNVSYDLVGLATAHALLGNNEQAYQLAQQAIKLYTLEMDRVGAPAAHAGAIFALALAGYRDEALVLIEQSLQTIGGFKRWYLFLDPKWDFFRDDKRFNTLVKPDNLDRSMHVNRENKNL